MRNDLLEEIKKIEDRQKKEKEVFESNMLLIKAASLGRTDGVVQAMERGASPKFKDSSGMNALMWAARHGSTQGIRSLLAASNEFEMDD